MVANPYHLPVPREGRGELSIARRALEPIICEHMEGFGDALEGHTSRATEQRVRAHQLLRLAMATARQSKFVAMEWLARTNPLAAATVADRIQSAFEAPLASSTLVTNVTAFVTQMVHVSLDVYPRLLAPRLVSVQPFTQPSGYVFFLKRLGGTAPRLNEDMSSKALFDRNYGDRGDFGSLDEGSQVKGIKTQLTKTLVEVKYKALMHQFSHEVDVALRTQYGMDIMALGDMATADELAWEVDREVVSAVSQYAELNTRGIKYWDPTNGGAYSGYAPSEKQAYDRTLLGTAFTEVAIEMAADVYVQPNWFLCGTTAMQVLARTPDFFAEDTGNGMGDRAGVQGGQMQTRVGRDGSLYIHDPQLTPTRIVCGHVDNMNPFYAGFIFSPFGAASLLTAAFQDPDVLLTKKSRALAFAKVGVRAQQFRVISLTASS